MKFRIFFKAKREFSRVYINHLKLGAANLFHADRIAGLKREQLRNIALF
jgi:hypothetical protein